MATNIQQERSSEVTTSSPSSGFLKPKVGASTWRRAGTAAFATVLVVLGLARRSLGGGVLALVGGWVLYRTIGRDTWTERESDRRAKSSETDGEADRKRDEGEPNLGSVSIERSVTIDHPAEELSEFLADPEHVGEIVGRFAEVYSAGEGRHHWEVHGPLDRRLVWEMELEEDRSDEHLQWENVQGSSWIDRWSATFRPVTNDRGTVVAVRVDVSPPGGRVGWEVTRRLELVPQTLLATALDRAKSLVETGEIPTAGENLFARKGGDLP